MCGRWYAVRTVDQEAVLDAFGLSGPVELDFAAAAEAWVDNVHLWVPWNHRYCWRMLVVTVKDWTLLFGRPTHELPPDEHAIELSRRFGAAHTYVVTCGDASTEWILAAAGQLVRHYDTDSPEQSVGPRHPAEDGYLLPHEEGFPDGALDELDPGDWDAYLAGYQRIKAELGVPDSCDATDIARRVSVDPSGLGEELAPDRCLLALTGCGRAAGISSAEESQEVVGALKDT